MKQTDTEKMLQNDPELDALLDQMAEDVPPMPADFHDNWMSAIRTEAKQAAPAAEEKEEKKPVSIVRWTRILSVAAMFVFLIGGTLLYRNTKGTMRPAMNAEKKEAAVMTEMAVTAVEEAAEEEAESEAYDPDRDAGNMPLSASIPMAAASDAAMPGSHPGKRFRRRDPDEVRPRPSGYRSARRDQPQRQMRGADDAHHL